ncbi:MAG: sporulation protein [Bacteroidales bacterium]|nr:sporulation protein [Bacteroidales bacterium]
MELKIEDLLDKVSEHLKSLASTDTVIGEEFTLGEYTCKPVIKIGTGFGSGVHSGELNKKYHGKGTGGGVGAGIGVIPLGFLVTKKDEISFIAVDKKTALSTLCEKVPDLVEKISEMKAKKEGKYEEEKKEKK